MATDRCCPAVHPMATTCGCCSCIRVSALLMKFCTPGCSSSQFCTCGFVPLSGRSLGIAYGFGMRRVSMVSWACGLTRDLRLKLTIRIACLLHS